MNGEYDHTKSNNLRVSVNYLCKIFNHPEVFILVLGVSELDKLDRWVMHKNDRWTVGF